jgi:hypothetical protein
MSSFAATGRLAQWDGTTPDLREWSDDDLLDGLRQLGIDTDRERFAALAGTVTMQSDVEDDWLQMLPVQDEGLAVFTWMGVQELWERWSVPSWPKDRLSRMFAYLVDSDFAVEWADRFHAPTAPDVFDALDVYLAQDGKGLPALEEMVEMLGMPAVAWPSKMLDAMAEWAEVGNMDLAERGGAFLAKMLGKSHGGAFLAAALVSAKMYDRAEAAAMQVPLEAPLDRGFGELVGYLCLAAGDAMLAAHWIGKVDKEAPVRKSELTFAAEAVRDYLDKWVLDGADDATPVPAPARAAAKQAAAQAAYYAFMAFAGDGKPGGGN